MLDYLPTAWCVKHIWNGEYKKFITLDKTKADDYAVKWHGTVTPLYEPRPEQTIADAPINQVLV